MTAALMGGHSTPEEACTQMTNEQKATDKRTPVKPVCGPMGGCAATIAGAVVSWRDSIKIRDSAALATGIFNKFPFSGRAGEGTW